MAGIEDEEIGYERMYVLYWKIGCFLL
jgi:hypothetical protein